MEVEFLLLDCDYIMLDDSPIIRLFGKTREGKSITVFYRGYLPYFYILPKNFEEVIEFLKTKFPNLLVSIREEERYLPIGYHSNKTKLLRITLKDPSKVPKVREELIKDNLVESVFEADILFRNRFMADFGLHGMRWIRAIGVGSATNTVKTDLVIEAKELQELEDQSLPQFKYMSIDVEVVPQTEALPDPKRDQIIMIGLAFSPPYKDKKSLVLVAKPVKAESKLTLFFKDEKELLEEFVKIMEQYDPDVIVGYNINNFDLPFILQRLSVNEIGKFIGRCKDKPATTKRVGARYKNNVTGRIVVDVYELIKESVSKGILRLKRYGLGDVAKEMLGEGKVDITHSEIAKYWNSQNLEKLIEYNRKDAELVLRLLLEKDLLSKFIEIARVCGLLLQDVLESGESARVENLLLREFNKEGFVFPVKPTEEEMLKRKEERLTYGLKGALVLEPKVGLHTNYVVYLDFKSMYPSLFIAYNICCTAICLDEKPEETIKTPTGIEFVSPRIRIGIIPKTVKMLIEERDRIRALAKKAKDEEERRNLEARQLALKYMANAFYGYTGYIRSRIYMLDIANTITACGRHLIQRTKEIVEADKRFSVLYGDTDSIMVDTKTSDMEEAIKLGEELEEKVNKELEGKVQMKTEGIFKALLILSKKRYAGLLVEKKDSEIKESMIMKGIETVRRDWCNLTSKTLLRVLEIILKERSPSRALAYVRDVMLKLERDEIPLEDLIITKGISKPLKEYKGVQPHVELVKKLRERSPAEAPGLGDRVGFVIIRGPQLLSERAEDPEYVREHGLKIDSKYYIESQILPPIERVFEAIGISRSELFGVGKQRILADMIKNTQQNILHSVESFICSKCNKFFRRPPLLGKCNCGGEILFYSNGNKSKYFSPF
jgi:DNA polymerase I